MVKWSISILLIMLLNLAVTSLGNVPNFDYHAFYFIHQWLPSYCNQKGTKCCYPPTGRPAADFTIYGLWPYNDGGNSLQNCPGSSYDVAPLKAIQNMLQKDWPSLTCPQIGRKFWLHEWNKHGTCSKSVLDELAYFHAASNMKNKLNIFEALSKARIIPNNQFYQVENIKAAITQATGYRPFIFCNHDAEGNSQIWQVIFCVDKSGTKLVNCSGSPQGQCAYSTVKFPSY
ncbi:ribonuclease 1-like [Amaranthus tricolor]|uniref:ribonuclease 1-like n=1 Tax=Amaranthus tricolor TaxID=29722 RepID=UPI002590BE9A|nr:ribonuclease 1-like [Amaranthus tricolor]